tara:strand:- start:1888 stop:2190 length:303 start_codon:yes stop_codon:yes gene_type:complete
MTISKYSTSRANTLLTIKKVSAYLQVTPLAKVVSKFKHSSLTGQLHRSLLISQQTHLNTEQARQLLLNSPELEGFFVDIETLLLEEGLFSAKKIPTPINI